MEVGGAPARHDIELRLCDLDETNCVGWGSGEIGGNPTVLEVSIDERGAIIEEAAAAPTVAAPVVVVEEDAATRKKRHNAPRRMAKLEDLIAEADAVIAAVDDDMVAAGADVGKAVDLQKRRDALQADLDGLWAEYDELDALLAVAA